MTHADVHRWAVGDLPFLWNPLRTPSNPEGLPNALPFALSVNPRTGAIVQEPSPAVSAALAHAYALGSMISGQMDETGIGRRYTDDFLDFISAPEGRASVRGSRILEIGCGNGYLLHRLARLGASVLGLEPGEHGQSKYNVPVIRDFFPSPQLAGTFDRVVLFGVLEHVEQPVDFLQQVLALLEPGGEVLIGVPDCAPYLAVGDLSCLIHEHWSYFDHRSLARTLECAGATAVQVTLSGFGGLLYARAGPRRTHRASDNATEAPTEYEWTRLRTFRARAEAGIGRIADYLRSAAAKAETVGVYVPGRIINALFVASVESARLRFFDDNALLTGTYFPGLAVAVEHRANLIDHPTDHLLIMSRSFGEAIAEELLPLLPSQTVIRTWHSFFDTGQRA